jgi:hypothetical protein
MVPWGDEGSTVRGWDLLLIARVGRGEEGARRKGDIYG